MYKILLIIAGIIFLIVSSSILVILNKETGFLSFFFIPNSTLVAETIATNIYTGDNYDAFLFIDRNTIIYNHFGTIEHPIQSTIKQDLLTNRQELVRHQDYQWTNKGVEWGENHREAVSPSGAYKVYSITHENLFNVDSGWGYQELLVVRPGEKVFGRYTGKYGFKSTQWGLNDTLYFITLDQSEIEGSIQKIRMVDNITGKK